MTGSGQKSLTDPPTNLKEAIDWVLRVSGRDNGNNDDEAINGLAKELIKLLDKDAGEVARGVLTVMGKSLTKVVEGLESFQKQHKIGTTALRGLINRVGKNLKKVTGYGSAASPAFIKMLRVLLQNDVINPGQGPITQLADRLKKLVETNSGMFKSQYEYSYNKSDATWPNKPDEQERCAYIFLGLLPLLFYFLPYLYAKCTDKGDWNSKGLANVEVKEFMASDAIGFKTDLDDSKNGSAVAELIDTTCFGEIKTALGNTKPEEINYATVIRHLEKSVAETSPPSDSPLTKCFTIASTFFTPIDTYTVETSSPVIPSLLGYSGLTAVAGGAYGLNLGGLGTFTSLFDCTSNLKEAIDCILRVTGKDGGGGGDNTAALAKVVQGLLGKAVTEVNSLNGNGRMNSGELTTLMAGLEKAKELVEKDLEPKYAFKFGPIGQLSIALRDFIGYTSYGVLSDSSLAGKITGAGIAPSNIATHRLCDATIAFTIGLLEGCKKKVKNTHHTTLDNVIKMLHGKYGTGTEGLKEVATKVQSGLNGQFAGTPVNQFIDDIGTAFDTHLKTISPDQAETVAGKVGEYLKGIFKGNGGSGWNTSDADQVDQKLKTLVRDFRDNKPYNPGDGSFSSNINTVQSALNPGSHGTVQPILDAGKKAFLDALKMPNYTRMDYDASYSIRWNSDTAKVQKCAKIFLGCLPLYYQALTYIYWGCHVNGGGWGNQTLANGAMRSYFDSQGLLPTFVDKSKRGAHIAHSALKGFSEFGKAATSSLKDSNSPYVKFTTKLRGLVKSEGSQNIHNSCPLSALYYGASCYFQYRQITNAKSAVRAPKTIREMLYFLAAMQFASAYDELNEHIGTLLNPSMSVADSSKPASSGNDTLSSDQLKDYLRASCAFSSSVLGLIQGPGASQNASDPWLFELFCNSTFQFKYPSGATLFSTVSSYAYSLQFQLLFLYSMCANNVNKCGWQDCIFGKEMKPNGSGGTVSSHMCPGLTCGGKSGCWHNGTGSGTNQSCKHSFHPTKNKDPTCGKATNSPLQAFLTDCINGLCRSHPTNSTSHLSTCSGALCHTPMGFQITHLRQNAANGARVYLVLKSICGNVSSPLRQLCLKLGCLTKRTPRSLGDLFGFTWHLKGQLSTTLNNITNAEWLKNLAGYTPFTNNLIEEHGKNLKNFVGTGHTSHDSSPMDLSSLHVLVQQNHSTCYGTGKTCGPYLSPLTLSNGATFGKTAPYASTYLSWMVYLTDDLQSQFQEMLEEFRNIDCEVSGCLSKQSCTSHPPGTHGTSAECKCESVVHCGGTLPLLYRHGFRYYSPAVLMGTSTKRDCKVFADQLQSVISGEPLRDLFTSIDEFLYLFRYYFLGNLSTFWTIYTCLILYTFFFLLDTLHLRSHLKLTSSHILPPLALLTQGTPLPVTKLTYIGQ
ncbi:variant erythrocyte surface antigen-1 family protein [Babesia caballi]|uniref:Variant erythrocyte surface antigen-1 family protein n=1 Tax=Babesia caballi TaxID=5871 RepID=A0AAV4LZH5_BABCB|nr:variant erythrocyte surface antigen-1 family protein [Babesia caballi]